MSTIYRNQRFKRGNTVSILYNPYLIIDTGAFTTVIENYNTYSIVEYSYGGLIYPSVPDIVTCSSFGGIAGISPSGSYSSEYENDIADKSYQVGYATIKIPRDCFMGNRTDYLDDYKDKIYVFDSTISIVENAYISEYITSTQYGKYGKYPINYRMNDDNRIKVILPEDNFDIICQIMMSQALAIVSCDDVYTDISAIDIPDGLIHSYPYGGGSLNPIIRQGTVMTNSIKKVRGLNSYELEIKLLG